MTDRTTAKLASEAIFALILLALPLSSPATPTAPTTDETPTTAKHVGAAEGGKRQTSQNSLGWVALGSLLSAFASAAGAFFIWRSVRVLKRTSDRDILHEILHIYSSNDMFEDLQNLRKWRDSYPDNFAEKWMEDKNKQENQDLWEKVTLSRRRVKNYFMTATKLHENNYLDKKGPPRELQIHGRDS